MIGRRYWIWIWWGILALGVVGFIGAIHWAIKTHWRNLEEVLRGIGTITVSVGMLLLLHQTGGGAGQTLLLAALIAFILVLGRDRKAVQQEPPDDSPPDSPSEPPPELRPIMIRCRAAFVLALSMLWAGGSGLIVAVPAQTGGAATGGLVRLAQEQRLAGNWRRVLMVGAHPDDEDTELLTILARGQGIETAYLSLTRGETEGRTSSARSSARRSACCAPRNSRRPAGWMVASSSSRERTTSASPRRRRKRSGSGIVIRSSRTWCGSFAGSVPR